MTDVSHALSNLFFLDEQAQRRTWLHRINPAAKFVTVIIFVGICAATGKYGLQILLQLALLPAALIISGNLPAAYLLKMSLWALPFVFFIGIFNPFFDQRPLLSIGILTITYGMLSFFTILFKGYVCLLSMLIFTCTSGVNGLAQGLSFLRIPAQFIGVLTFMYRYIFVLAGEVSSILKAYSLRAYGHKGVHISRWGSLAGQFFIRSIEKSQRIYNSTQIKGYGGKLSRPKVSKFRSEDALYAVICIGFALCSFLGVWTFMINKLLSSF